MEGQRLDAGGSHGAVHALRALLWPAKAKGFRLGEVGEGDEKVRR
jgi:hypothetical protein